MNDEERLRIAAPYLLMVVLGLMVILLPMWARTLGVLGAVTGASGLVWACWGAGNVGRVRAYIFRRRVRSAPPAASTDEYVVLAVPCEKEIYDEMTKAVAEGLRLAQVPGLEKPREL